MFARPYRALLIMLLLCSSGAAALLAQERAAPPAAGTQAPLGTAFTYQGQLADSGRPASGAYDITFKLFDAATGGAQVGATLTKQDVAVSNGLFTVQLDFGAVFEGDALFLEITVQPGDGSGSPATLTPRQPLTGVPGALYASSAGALRGQPLGGAAPASGEVLTWDGAAWEPQPVQGQPGPQGPQGLKSLLKTTAEPAGANCPTGGTKVEVGIDANGNGTLEAGEVDAAQTRYVCNGAQGPQGIQGPQGATGATGPQGAQGPQGIQGANGLISLLRTSFEPAGGNCATGGAKIEAGIDANGNGTLDAGEENAALTRYVCNGAQGPQGIQGPQGAAGPQGANGLNALIKTSAEPAGANCATGGTKVETGVDANGNGSLEAGEVNAALTRYVCNGAQGPQGIQGAPGPTGATGATGAQGPQGPQGPSGASGSYGDGSAGALTVGVAGTLDLRTVADVNSLEGKANLQFTNITINGTLIVPSGTVLRATGAVVVGGTITVDAAAQDNGSFSPHPGIALSPAASLQGGTGLALLQAASLVKPEVYGGGGGARSALTSGGGGGGAFAIYAQGNITVSVGGIITANGQNGVNPNTAGAGIVGGGGGGGGVVVLLSKGTATAATPRAAAAAAAAASSIWSGRLSA